MTKSSMAKEYLGIADMMSGLMMVFMLIAVAFMVSVEASKKEVERQRDAIEHQKNEIEAAKKEVERQRDAMAEIAEMADRSRLALHQELRREFRDDLARWNAAILEDNTVRFKAPDILFKTGRSRLRNRFKRILTDFFPRYVRILQAYEADIDAVRIEGHTSSDWHGVHDMTRRYLKNVQLSQRRALATLEYCYQDTSVTAAQQKWLRTVLRANGLSFARPILKADQKTEDAKKSRRVEFKVVTNAEKRLYQILERSK